MKELFNRLTHGRNELGGRRRGAERNINMYITVELFVEGTNRSLHAHWSGEGVGGSVPLAGSSRLYHARHKA